MARKGPDLKKLVALRRQKAEQALALLQADIRAGEEALVSLQAELASLDKAAGDFGALSLAHRHGRPGALLARISETQAQIAENKGRLPAMRDAVKAALHSEQRLSDLEAGR